MNKRTKRSADDHLIGGHKRQLGIFDNLATSPVVHNPPPLELSPKRGFTVLCRRAAPRPTVVFETSWRFAAERQEIFWRRLSGAWPPWTQDPILLLYKFTNAYRASDRVSQYLIRHVLYKGEQTPREVFFRTILFKFFNKIETWELLVRTLGWPRASEYKVGRYHQVLSDALSRGERIYSAAYIMPSALDFGSTRKHLNHLLLLEKMLQDCLPDRVTDAPNMQSVFQLLRAYHSIGDFLAFQLTIDLNYGTITNFDEMEFVVPGPGARDGIHKCFSSLGDSNPADIIRFVTETQSEQFAKRGIPFKPLWSRPLQLVDCQNVFCEVDKYARLAHPEISGRSDRKRIKQRYRPNLQRLSVWYPPKWGINEAVASDSSMHTAEPIPDAERGQC